jgi:hypothetical protein
MLHQALAAERLWMLDHGGRHPSTFRSNSWKPSRPIRRCASQLAYAERGTASTICSTVCESAIWPKKQPLDAPYAAAYAFLNSPAFLDFVRALTGDPRRIPILGHPL